MNERLFWQILAIILAFTGLGILITAFIHTTNIVLLVGLGLIAVGQIIMLVLLNRKKTVNTL